MYFKIFQLFEKVSSTLLLESFSLFLVSRNKILNMHHCVITQFHCHVCKVLVFHFKFYDTTFDCLLWVSISTYRALRVVARWCYSSTLQLGGRGGTAIAGWHARPHNKHNPRPPPPVTSYPGSTGVSCVLNPASISRAVPSFCFGHSRLFSAFIGVVWCYKTMFHNNPPPFPWLQLTPTLHYLTE